MLQTTRRRLCATSGVSGCRVTDDLGVVLARLRQLVINNAKYFHLVRHRQVDVGDSHGREGWLYSLWRQDFLVTFRLRRSRGEMYIGHARLRVSLAAFPHYCTDPDTAWENGRGCPLVVHY